MHRPWSVVLACNGNSIEFSCITQYKCCPKNTIILIFYLFFFWFYIQVIFYQFLHYLFYYFMMPFFLFCSYNCIIYKACQFSDVDQISQNLIHYYLKHCRWVHQAKEYYCWFKEFFQCYEHCLPLIFFLYSYIIIVPT